MTKPNPEVGLIIRYEYLWKSEEQDGLNKGEKHRPCAVILALPTTNPPKAMVCPITHSEPRNSDVGIEIPDEEKGPMGLDADRQWIVVSEANLTDWDHPAVIELDNGSWTYGRVPRVILDTCRARYMAIYGDRGAADTVVNRPRIV